MPLIVANYSDLSVDCTDVRVKSRSIPAVSDKTEIPGNKDLDPYSQKLRRIFYPYHNAIDLHGVGTQHFMEEKIVTLFP